MNPLTQYLYAALASEYGIILSHSDRRALYGQISKARATDPAFARISITMPEEQPTWLMLVKCPDEKQNLLTVITSSSTPPISSGSTPTTVEPSESPKPSE